MVANIVSGVGGFVLGYLTRWVQESGRARAAYAAAMVRAQETKESVSERFRRKDEEESSGE